MCFKKEDNICLHLTPSAGCLPLLVTSPNHHVAVILNCFSGSISLFRPPKNLPIKSHLLKIIQNISPLPFNLRFWVILIIPQSFTREKSRHDIWRVHRLETYNEHDVHCLVNLDDETNKFKSSRGTKSNRHVTKEATLDTLPKWNSSGKLSP